MRDALLYTHGSWPSSAGITTPTLSSGFYGAVCRGGDSAPRLRLGPGRGGSRSRCRGWWAKAADPDVAAAGAKAAALRAVAAGAKPGLMLLTAPRPRPLAVAAAAGLLVFWLC